MRLWAFHTFILKKYAFHPRFFHMAFCFWNFIACTLENFFAHSAAVSLQKWGIDFWPFFLNRRKYRSQNTNVFAELDAETVTSVDCDGMIFDPTTFKAVREVSCWFKVTWHHLNTLLYPHVWNEWRESWVQERETERAWESERESCFC